ncbi:MAG: thioesterase family protein [Trueperaceae bacterium]
MREPPCTTLRVRFAETDQMGIAHHSAYVVWMEAARVEWLRERGLSYRQLEEEGVSLAVSGLELAYRAAALFDDEVEVEAKLIEARSRRFRFSYRLGRPVDATLLATGATVHVPTDRRGRAIRLPRDWLVRLTGLVQSEHRESSIV